MSVLYWRSHVNIANVDLWPCELWSRAGRLRGCLLAAQHEQRQDNPHARLSQTSPSWRYKRRHDNCCNDVILWRIYTIRICLSCGHVHGKGVIQKVIRSGFGTRLSGVCKCGDHQWRMGGVLSRFGKVKVLLGACRTVLYWLKMTDNRGSDLLGLRGWKVLSSTQPNFIVVATCAHSISNQPASYFPLHPLPAS